MTADWFADEFGAGNYAQNYFGIEYAMTFSKKITVEPLRKRHDFLRLARAAQVVRTGVVVQATPHGGTDIASNMRNIRSHTVIRFGLTVSKKCGNAVRRNRIRRRLRELARDVLAHEGRVGIDYVLVGRTNTYSRHYDALSDDLRQALIQLHRRGELSSSGTKGAYYVRES